MFSNTKKCDKCPTTKRQFLAYMAEFYDPLKLYTPATPSLKLFLQIYGRRTTTGINRSTARTAKVLQLYWNSFKDKQSGSNTWHCYSSTSTDRQNFAGFRTRAVEENRTIFFWSESQAILHWIATTTTVDRFVDDRLAEIRRSSAQFPYVDSANNPADLARCGLTIAELEQCSQCWEGPSFLQQETQHSPEWTAPHNPVTLVIIPNPLAAKDITECGRFSCLNKLKWPADFLRSQAVAAAREPSSENDKDPAYTADSRGAMMRSRVATSGDLINSKR
uniref:DUF1758 domain-containing protein n=1 Tax=Ascaris lumbricoides TaxID=6252 RepID=A0A0M3IDS0_ASCLU